MPYNPHRRTVLLPLMAGLAALLLAGCGIKGDLVRPSQIQKEERSEPGRAQDAI